MGQVSRFLGACQFRFQLSSFCCERKTPGLVAGNVELLVDSLKVGSRDSAEATVGVTECLALTKLRCGVPKVFFSICLRSTEQIEYTQLLPRSRGQRFWIPKAFWHHRMHTVMVAVYYLLPDITQNVQSYFEPHSGTHYRRAHIGLGRSSMTVMVQALI